MQTKLAALAISPLLSLACSASGKSHADAGLGQATTEVGGTHNDVSTLDVSSSAVDEGTPDFGAGAATGGRMGAGGATASLGGAPGSGGEGGMGGRTDLLLNGDFEQGSGDTPAVWQRDSGWDPAHAAYHWVAGAGRNGSYASTIESSTANDAHFMQNGVGEPFRVYKLSGYIKGQGLSGGAGATIGLPGWGPNVGRTGTFDWTLFEMPVATIADGSFEVWVRIGGYGNVTSGKAYFDDLTMVQDDRYVSRIGKHVAFMLRASDTTSITDVNFTSWLNRLDSVYEAYADLVGAIPHGGQSMGVFSLSGLSAWADAGYPIQWNQDYVSETLKSVNDTDEWCFGIMHEMGHNFDDIPEYWNFHAEYFANFKLHYAVETLNGITISNGVLYHGAELRNFWKQKYEEQWVGQHQASTDGLQYKWLLIQDQIGWQPFKDAFRYFQNPPDPQNLGTPWRKLQRWHDILGQKSGKDVWATFTQDEINMLKAAFPDN